MFPFPPVLRKKWLVVCDNEEFMNKVLVLLSEQKIPNPLEDKSAYEELGLHLDAQTPLYKLKDEYLHS